MNDTPTIEPVTHSPPERKRQRRIAYALLLPLIIVALSVCLLIVLFATASRGMVDSRTRDMLELVALLSGPILAIAFLIALVPALVGLVYVVWRRRTLNDPVLFVLAGLLVLGGSLVVCLLLWVWGGTMTSELRHQAMLNQSAKEQAEFAPTANALLQEAKSWHLVASDSFENEKGRLPVGTEKYAKSNDTFAQVDRTVTNGKYHWQTESSPFSSNQLPAIVKGLNVSDFYASADVQRLTGDNPYMGLVFRLNGQGHYLFTIDDASQTYDLLYNEQRGGYPQSSGTLCLLKGCSMSSDLIRPGESNRLTVIGKGSRFVLFINDKYVGYADNTRSAEGQIGVEMHTAKDNPAVVEFDNFEVRVP